LEDLVESSTLQLIRYFQFFCYLIGGADPSPVPEPILHFAQQIIEFWVSALIQLSKGTAAKPSIHFMLHVVEDCRFFKCHFDCISAFIYENCLRFVKNDINSGNFKLQQLRNRMLERTKYSLNRDASGRILRTASGEPSMGWNAQAPTLQQQLGEKSEQFFYDGARKFKQLTLPDFQLNSSLKDSFVLVRVPSGLSVLVPQHKHVIVQVTDFSKRRSDKSLVVKGHVYRKKESLFTTPDDSKSQYVYALSQKSDDLCCFDVSSIVAKMYVIPRFSKFQLKTVSPQMLGDGFSNVKHWVAIALRHTLSEGASLY
jgi:hypothetical protein